MGAPSERKAVREQAGSRVRSDQSEAVAGVLPEIARVFEEGGAMCGFVDETGLIDPNRVAGMFQMSRGQLAEMIGLNPATVATSSEPVDPRLQTRLVEMLEIIARVRGWAGGVAQAVSWYRSQPLPAVDGRTAEALVKSGQADLVGAYLDRVALGGYA